MLRTVTAKYRSHDAVRNVLDDLVNIGIEREKIYADEGDNVVKVMIPEVAQPEVLEILGRHHPLRLS